MINHTQDLMQPDDWKINMSDAWQVLWWCRYLGLTKTQLETAIMASGNGIVDVKRYLEAVHFETLDQARGLSSVSETGKLQPAL